VAPSIPEGWLSVAGQMAQQNPEYSSSLFLDSLKILKNYPRKWLMSTDTQYLPFTKNQTPRKAPTEVPGFNDELPTERPYKSFANPTKL